MEIKTIGEIVGANTEGKQYTEADVYAVKSLKPNQEVRGKMNENGVVYRKVVYWTMLKDSPYTRCPICLKMSHGQTVSILRHERHKYASQIDGNEFKIGYEDWYVCPKCETYFNDETLMLTFCGKKEPQKKVFSENEIKKIFSEN